MPRVEALGRPLRNRAPEARRAMFPMGAVVTIAVCVGVASESESSCPPLDPLIRASVLVTHPPPLPLTLAFVRFGEEGEEWSSSHSVLTLSLSLGFRKRPRIDPKKAIEVLRSRFAGLGSGVSPGFEPELGNAALAGLLSFPWVSETLARALGTEGAVGKKRADADGLSIDFRITSNGSFSTTSSGPTGCSSSELVSCVPEAARVVGNIVRDTDGLALMLWWEREEGPSEPSSETSVMC